MEQEEPVSSGPETGAGGAGEELHIVQVETVGQFPKWRAPECVKQEAEEGLLTQSWEVQWQDFLKMVQSPHSEVGGPEVPGTFLWGNTKRTAVPVEESISSGQWAGEKPMAQILPGLHGSRSGEDYGKVKEEEESKCVLDAETQRQLFRQFGYQDAKGPRETYSQLHKLCHGWLKPEKHTKDQILELVVLEQFLTVLPQGMRSWVQESLPETGSQAVALAEDFLLRNQPAKGQEESEKWIPEASPKHTDHAEALGLIGEDAANFPDAKQTSLETTQKWLIQEINKESRSDTSLQGGDVWASDHDSEARGMLLKSEELEGSPGQQDEREGWKARPAAGRDDTICKITPPPKMYRRGKGRIVCTLCGKSFSTKSSFNRHHRIHTGEKPFKCQDCNESFLARSNLVRHQRIHTGEKPYKCSDCEKRFSRRANLVTHRRSHTGEKPYKCSDCGRMFNQSAHLVRHQRIHVRKRLYECTDCGKGFSQGTLLSDHQRIHVGGKPYGSSDCSMTFHDKSSLNRRRSPHVGQKLYKCLQCSKGFSRRSVLTRHQRIHTGEKPYPCSDCSKTFLSTLALTAHQRIHMGEETV